MSNTRGLMSDKPYLCIVRPFIQARSEIGPGCRDIHESHCYHEQVETTGDT